ncbi:MAG: hypothetical protein ABH828_06105, partial [archaeon]
MTKKTIMGKRMIVLLLVVVFMLSLANFSFGANTLPNCNCDSDEDCDTSTQFCDTNDGSDTKCSVELADEGNGICRSTGGSDGTGEDNGDGNSDGIDGLLPGTVDVVSNGEEWFVCAAALENEPFTEAQGVNYVAEGALLSIPVGSLPADNCLELFNQLYASALPDYRTEFTNCQDQGNDGQWCCNEASIAADEENPTERCLDQCFIANNIPLSARDNLCETLGINCEGAGGAGTSEEVSKADCGTYLSCFTGLPFGPGIQCVGNDREFCKAADNEFCSNGVVVASSNAEDGVCCLGENAECIVIEDEEQSCTALGGELCADPSHCLVDAPESMPNCCLGGSCIGYEEVEPLDESQSFICYADQKNSKFGECCFDNKCYNSDLLGAAFGTGVALHTIKSYDYFDGDTEDTKFYTDKVMVNSKVGKDEKITIYLSYAFSDWNDFEYLEFIFASNDINAFHEIKLQYTDNSTSSSADFYTHFSHKLKNNTRWNYVVVPLSAFSIPESKKVSKIIITLKDYAKGSTGLYAAYDNFMLRETGNSDKTNTENQYCSGGLGTWIPQLDPEDAADTTAYRIACNSQMAFTWTGSQCCGDDTRPEGGEENFEDSLHGCFEGVTVLDDQILANATNAEGENKINKYLLFYEEQFHACGDDAKGNSFMSLLTSNSETGNGNYLVSNQVDYFSVVGSWYCSPEGWELLSNAKRMRILASKLKFMGGNDYTLHCGEKTAEGVIPYVMNLDSSSNTAEIDGICVLQKGDDVTIGVAVDKDNVDPYINDDIRLIYHELNDEDSGDFNTPYDCSSLEGDPSPDNFFQQCVVQGKELRLNYNPDFGVLLLQFEERPDTFLKFMKSMWTQIKEFFSGLFSNEDSVDPYTVAKEIDVAEFNELFINVKSSRTIKGVIEDGKIIVKYEGFNDLSFLENLVDVW